MVILDDLRADFAPLHTLLRLFDGYPLSVEVKGGHRVVKARRFYVTAPCPPSMFYSSKRSDDEDVRQLLRRITTVRQFWVHPNSDGVMQYDVTNESEIQQVGVYFL